MKTIAKIVLGLTYLSIVGFLGIVILIGINPSGFENVKQILTVFLICGAISYTIFYYLMSAHVALNKGTQDKILELAFLRWVGIGPFLYYYKVFLNPVIENPTSTPTTTVINPPISEKKNKTFSNYYGLILFAINLIIAVIFSMQPNIDAGGMLLGLYYALIFLCMPFVIFSLSGKHVKELNMLVSFLLIPPILISIFLLFLTIFVD
jgi:hypothetical protein